MIYRARARRRGKTGASDAQVPGSIPAGVLFVSPTSVFFLLFRHRFAIMSLARVRIRLS